MELEIDILVGQEPCLVLRQKPHYNDQETRSTAHADFVQILPRYNPILRPINLVYAAKREAFRITLAPESPEEPDFQILDLEDGNNKNNSINCYNQNNQVESISRANYTIKKCMYGLKLPLYTVIMGDINLHHQVWDNKAVLSTEANELLDWMEQRELEFMNQPGEGTCFRPHMNRATVIDLKMATTSMKSRVKD